MGGHFDDDVGGLHDCDGQNARLQLELVCRLTTNQRHDAVRTGLNLDLGHHRVAEHPSNQANETVSGRL